MNTRDLLKQNYTKEGVSSAPRRPPLLTRGEYKSTQIPSHGKKRTETESYLHSACSILPPMPSFAAPTVHRPVCPNKKEEVSEPPAWINFARFLSLSYSCIYNPRDRVEDEIIQLCNLQTDLSKLQTPRANSWSHESTRSDSCKSPCISSGSEPLPKGIVMRKSDLEMVPLWGPPKAKGSSDLHAANHRLAVRRRSYVELEIFRNRWQKAMVEDKCWTNSYPEP
ncbi:hypothetical protein BHE74_00040721 [Ensete ventricosum]|nr:hypothetical protein BHE74_00040721 [Ensete ventricosum]